MDEEKRAGRSRWEQLSDGPSGEEYQARFARLAASGAHVHGEADLCIALLDAAGRPRAACTVLDAGCGTGRVAIRLASQGVGVVGVDVDPSMLAVAREQAPGLPWFGADLATLTPADLGGAADFDLVLMAGNVVPLLAEGDCAAAVSSLAALLRPGGLLVSGFGLDPAHLPAGCPITPLGEYDEAAAGSGLRLVDRFSTWEGAPYDPAEGYAVNVHRLP
jgi:SAM-dependent methyltransferase